MNTQNKSTSFHVLLVKSMYYFFSKRIFYNGSSQQTQKHKQCVFIFSRDLMNMVALLRRTCLLVSSNSRGWMEDRLSGSQGRVDRLLKTVE